MALFLNYFILCGIAAGIILGLYIGLKTIKLI